MVKVIMSGGVPVSVELPEEGFAESLESPVSGSREVDGKGLVSGGQTEAVEPNLNVAKGQDVVSGGSVGDPSLSVGGGKVSVSEGSAVGPGVVDLFQFLFLVVGQ